MSDQPLNGAWMQGADGKWYPPEQLWGRAVATPGAPPRPPRRWPWVAVALGGLTSFIVLAALGATGGGGDEVDASAEAAPSSTVPSTFASSTTSELGDRTTTSTTTTAPTTSTTGAPTTAPTTAPPPPPPTVPPPPETVPPTTAPPPPPPAPVAPAPGPAGVHYQNCAAARAAGAAPVLLGEPGYGRHLDRDGDGIGCE